MNTVAQSKPILTPPPLGAPSQISTPEFDMINIDSSFRVVSTTGKASGIFGVPLSKGQALRESRLPGPILDLCSMALESRHESHLIIRDPQGTRTELELVAIPFADESSPVRVSILIREAALSGYVSQNIRRLDRLANIGLFSASMAHEIKNALVAVKAFADLLVEKDPGNEFATVMQRETGRIENIVNRMLRFAKPMRQSITQFDLHEVLDHSLRMLGRQIEAQSHVLERDFKAVNTTVEGDQLQLEQAFVNLILNAVEAMECRGTLKVATSDEALAARTAQGTNPVPCIRVVIEDTGPGILAENQQRLFEPFYTTKENGTGLGLPIARTIIIEHNGTIEVQSEPGRGTGFSVLLPLADQPPRT